ncbi:MAG: hypothetical protein K2Q29_09310 [Sphingomonadales bacterium]|nr:hypothetical protein [Sphingomonadales bacterium]
MVLHADMVLARPNRRPGVSLQPNQTCNLAIVNDRSRVDNCAVVGDDRREQSAAQVAGWL